MSESLAIHPWSAPVCGAVALPGSKSIAARALILGALSSGKTTLKGLPVCDDTQAMIQSLQALGFIIENQDHTTLLIQGEGGKVPHAQATINVQDAGTAARFLPALAALHPSGTYYFTSNTSIKKRPIEPLLQALEQQGALIVYHDKQGYYPFTLKTKGLVGGQLTLEGHISSQFYSALLMVSPYTQAPLSLTLEGDLVSAPFVDITRHMMNAFRSIGIPHLQNLANPLSRTPYSGPQNNTYTIEPDATAASYFSALTALLGGTLRIKNGAYIKLQGDKAFLQTLLPYGLQIAKDESDWVLTSQGLTIPAFVPEALDFKAISDTFITFAALSPLLKNPITLTGLTHTRAQESDRVKAVATALKALGQIVHETTDTLHITPQPLLSATINPMGDHRLSMAFGILGCYPLKNTSKPWLSLKNPHVCRKTFPNFFETLNLLKKTAHA